ncbi:MAG: site-specific integrase [Ruminococcus sp.]|nr:site-specific integrase [Ruminococcus sp.]
MTKPERTQSGKWRIRVEYYDNGKRRFKSFTAPTKKEVLALGYQFESEKQKLSRYDEMTLQEAFDRYINARAGALSPSTVRGYGVIKRNSFEMLMPFQLKDITAEMIQTAISEMSLTMSPKTVRNRHGLLVSVLKAYRPSLMINTHLPQSEQKERAIPTAAEVRECLDNASEYLRVPILLASAGSLRRSEVCALTPEDITDLGVRVNKAVVHDSDRNLVTKYPKSTAGFRFCPLSKSMIKEVREWKHFGLSPDKIKKEYQKLKNKHGYEFTFHSFRHYFASELHAQGVPDKYIAKVGGWKDVSTVQKIYQHTLKDKEKIYNKKIVDIFATELRKKA